jgi:asparagine synthase (glutamine-hydrolysing)
MQGDDAWCSSPCLFFKTGIDAVHHARELQPEARVAAVSALAAWFDPRRGPPEAAVVESLLRLLPREPDDRMEYWTADGVALGIARHDWQCTEEFEGSVLVARSDRAVVISDATLYGTDSLLSELSAFGPPPPGKDPASVILRAWERWGDDCARHLRGDFAFIVWDRLERRALFCRDIVGRRALYVRSGPGSSIAVASRARALAVGVEPVARPNLHVVAAAASALPGGSLESGYAGIRPVPAGATMSWSPKLGLQTVSQWQPPPFQVRSNESMEDAAPRLREVLKQSVCERIAGFPATIWLSGGADSTAVFAVGMSDQTQEDPATRLRPISISYPQGDTGREDEHILALTGLWQSQVSWIDSETVDLFEGVEERAALRDDPFAHTFGPMTSALSRSTRAAGSRVALDGYGGDALFVVTRGWVADLLMAGELRAWWHSLGPAGHETLRSAIRWGLLPALPDWTWRLFDKLRTRPLVRPLQYPIVSWLTSRAQDDLKELGWTGLDIRRSPREGPAAFECRAGLIAPHFARALAATRESTVPFGVEVRSPFMDDRVIDLAASRPVAERANQGNTKRLLKAAVKGIVPESVLAPRPIKTGLAAGYLHRQLQRQLLSRLQQSFGATSAMGDLGLVEPGAVLRHGRQYDANPDHLTGVCLYLTLEAEYWLRSR